jgi:hypothetical protein
MKLIALTTLALLITSCGQKESISLIKGEDGKDGKNGHSLVSQYDSDLSECASGTGSRLDIYIDIDDSLDVSEGDKFQSSLITCDGSDGVDGDQGAIGPVGPQGLMGAAGPQGVQGSQGIQGIKGDAGLNGAGCTLTQDGPNSYTLTCGNSSVQINTNQGGLK